MCILKIHSEKYHLASNEYPIPVSFFRKAGLRIPLVSLMVDFLSYCNLSLNYLVDNFIRIISGIDKLNKIHGTTLGLTKLHSLSRQTFGFNHKVRNDAPSLMLASPDSQKESDKDAIIMIGDIVPNPQNKPIPRHARGLGSCSKIIFLLFCFFYILV